MLIMGIDPGTALAGYGFCSFMHRKIKVVDYGCIRTSAKELPARRLALIFDAVEELLKLRQPDHLVIEQLFFNKNVRTALSVGQARGVILLAAARAGIPTWEYTPLQVKEAVTGYGRASKKQVQDMVRLLLNLSELPRPDDVADALAVAVCHAHSLRFNSLSAEGRLKI